MNARRLTFYSHAAATGPRLRPTDDNERRPIYVGTFQISHVRPAQPLSHRSYAFSSLSKFLRHLSAIKHTHTHTRPGWNSECLDRVKIATSPSINSFLRKIFTKTVTWRAGMQGSKVALTAALNSTPIFMCLSSNVAKFTSITLSKGETNRCKTIKTRTNE